MKYFMIMTMTLLLAAGAILAQGIGGGAGVTNQNTILLKTDKGLFALRAGVLVKYDATTLQQVAEYQIFGAMPDQPADRTDMTAMTEYLTALTKRQGPAIMLATKDSLLIIIADSFGRIDQDTLKPLAKASLLPVVDPNAAAADPNAVAPAGGIGRITGRQMAEATPGYYLDGTTLYIMLSKEVLAVNITDGTILSRTTLAKELLPLQNMMGGGGFGNGRGGAGPVDGGPVGVGPAGVGGPGGGADGGPGG